MTGWTEEKPFPSPEETAAVVDDPAAAATLSEVDPDNREQQRHEDQHQFEEWDAARMVLEDLAGDVGLGDEV